MVISMTFEQLKNDRQLWSLCLVVIIVVLAALKFISYRETQRPTIHGQVQIKNDITALRRDVKKLEGMQPLDSVDKYWLALFAEAELNGLELKPVQVVADARYKGPLHSRTGSLRGPTDVLLSTLHTIQGAIPFFLYKISVEGDVAEVTVSVVGV